MTSRTTWRNLLLAGLIAANTCAVADDDIPVLESETESLAPPAASSREPKEPSDEDADETPDRTADDPADLRETSSENILKDAQDRLQRAFSEMQTARQRISESDTGETTQAAQKQALRELEDILALIKKHQQLRSRQQSQPKDGQKSQQQPNQRPDSNPGRRDQRGPGQSPQDQAAPPQSQRSDGDAADSEERDDAARKLAAEQFRRRQALKDVWGHLPAHVREAMLNSLSEKYLPRYEDLVKQYYEDLAEKSRKPSGK